MNKIRGLFFIPAHLREEIEGDLLQRFERDVVKKGVRRAKVKLAFNVIRFFRPGILFRRNPRKRSTSTFMHKNYFLIAIRNMMAHKTNSSINILSLIVGITSALIMISVIRYELSFDRFHSNNERIYRINRYSQNGFDSREPGIAYPVADVFRNEVSAVEKVTGVQYYGGVQVDVELNGEVRKFREIKGAAFVDHEFFNIFDFHGTDFKWIAGDPKTALKDPFSLVITESMAKKYFGNVNALDKSIVLEGELEVKITGIIKDIPANSDLPFTLLVSYATLPLVEGEDRMTKDWNSINANHQAYVLLPEKTSPAEVEDQFDKVHAMHVDKDMADGRKYRLQALSEVHKDGRLGNFNGRTVDTSTLWIMGITGLLLLAVGCINYINIATAQSTLRGREIGVRKVLGGQKKQLILQFLSETFVLVSVACILSLFIAETAIVGMSELINVTLLRHLFLDPFVIISLGVLILIITFIAGLYPAIIVSAFGIIDALKGSMGGISNSNFLRKSLVVAQFAVTQIFLIGAFIVISQLQYSRTLDLGFDKDFILNVPVPENSRVQNSRLRNIVLGNPAVSSISISSSLPAGSIRNNWFVSVRKKEATKEQSIITENQSIDTAFFKLYGIKIIAGRNFVNSDSVNSAILNEVAISGIGYKTPEDAIGGGINLDGKDFIIVGVMKDFHNGSTKKKIGAMTFVYKPAWYYMSSIKLKANSGNFQEVILSLEKTWAEVYPTMLFDYDFFDQNIERYYREEKKLSSLLQIFSGIFLLIACLGLYGLVSFVINRRMKEVAVRKVFGAGVVNIISLISKDYVILILISFVIAAPSSYYFMDRWLEGFEFHVPITWWILIIPGILALTIAVTTLSGKLLKAASRNPAETLKYE
jgi:putative ABC transport system permease protein